MRAIWIVPFLMASSLAADPATVEAITAQQTGEGWRFDVTIRHADTGWDDYADGWRVLDMEGNILGTRILHHPHVNEQPFTRSLTGVTIPAGITEVQIETKDSVGGWVGTGQVLDLRDPNYAR